MNDNANTTTHNEYYEAAKKYKGRSLFAETWRRLKKNKLVMVAMGVIILLLLLAIFADVLFDYEEYVVKTNVSRSLEGPSRDHPLGTDEIGRDVLARIVHGARYSLAIGFLAVSFAFLVGSTLGAIAGYFGGPVSDIIMRLSDIFSAIPSLLLAIVIVTAFGQGLLVLMIAVGVSTIPAYIRIVRASVMTLRDQEFVEAAKAIGARNYQIILSHILPNCLAPIIVQASLSIGSGILAITGLSFIGSGVASPTPEWGSMLASARRYLRDCWHIAVFPGAMIMLTVLAFNLFGDGLRDALDPKLKK